MITRRGSSATDLSVGQNSNNYHLFGASRGLFAANSVTDAKKSAVLLSCVGSKTYGVVKNLLAPDLPASKDFATLCTTLIVYYGPKSSVIAQRCTFHKRRQLPGKSIADFIAEIRRLAIFCDFGTHLDDTLRDQFVSSLRNEAILKRLLSEETLKLLTYACFECALMAGKLQQV